MSSFRMNGILWRIYYVHPDSFMLIDRTGAKTVATTDSHTKCIYLSDTLRGSFLTKVLIHELGHCAMISYNLVDDIHSVVDEEYWVEAEEWVCNFIANYGMMIFSTARKLLGNDALTFIPYAISEFVA